MTVVLYIFRNNIVKYCNSLFVVLTGKSLINRSLTVQIVFLLSIILLSFCLLVFIQNKFFRKIDSEKSIIARITIYLPLVITFVLFCILAWNVRLRRDDYWEIHDSQILGPFGFIRENCLNVNCRYASLFFKSLYKYFSPVVYINISLIVIFLLLFIGLCLINKLFLENFTSGLSSKFSLILSIAMSGNEAVGILLMSPKIWEVHFWGSGTFVYGTGIAFTILSLSLVLKSVTRGASESLPLFILALIFCFFACGCSELTTISLCIFSLSSLLFFKISNKSHCWNKKLIVFWLFSWTAGFFSLTFSGGGARAKNYIDVSSLRTLTVSVYLRTSEVIQKDISSNIDFFNYRPKLFLLFLMISFFLGMLIHMRREKIGETLLISMVMLTAAFSCLIPNVIIRYIPPRVMEIPWIWIFMACCLIALMAGSLFAQKNSTNLIYISLLLGTVVPMIIFSWFYFNNIDMAHNIRTEWDYRDQLLQKVDKTVPVVETCQIMVLGSNWPDISDDPANEYNKNTAKYYGVKQIKATESCESWMRSKE
ncbi:MAG: DUF6056 family protein [Flexilinea sp.]